MQIEMTKIKRNFEFLYLQGEKEEEEGELQVEAVRANRCRELALELAGVGCHDNDACQHEINH